MGRGKHRKYVDTAGPRAAPCHAGMNQARSMDSGSRTREQVEDDGAKLGLSNSGISPLVSVVFPRPQGTALHLH